MNDHQLNSILLEDNWKLMATELASIRNGPIFDGSNVKTREEIAQKITVPSWVNGWDGYNNWLAWGLVMNGRMLPYANLTPNTEEILNEIKGLKFAAFLNLKAGSLIKKHNHEENKGLLTYHLGLAVPSECYLNSDGKFIKEQDGLCIVFDGTKSHYAFNASDKDRYILHCEVSQ